jgi:hypothetical protein
MLRDLGSSAANPILKRAIKPNSRRRAKDEVHGKATIYCGELASGARPDHFVKIFHRIRDG